MTRFAILASVLRDMATDRIQSYLEGRWQDGEGEGAPLVNPATEDVVATATTAGIDFAAGLAHARKVGVANLGALTFAERGALLQRMSTALHDQREALIASAIANGGCTRGDAKFDIDGAILVFSHYAELGAELGDKKILADGDGIQLGRSPRFWGQHVFVPREGVAILINAFNFPAWGFAEKAACALLAGMPVITKPATATAHTAWLSTKAIVEAADVPEGAFGFIGGGVGDLLDHVTGQDILAFTGSASTGAMLRSNPKIVEKSVHVNVEADSLNAAVLGPDLDLGSEGFSLFVREVSREMTQKTGQKCTAVRRIFLPEANADEVIEALGERLTGLVIGDPSNEDVRMGPLASARQLADVEKGIALLREEADVVVGDPDKPFDKPNGKGFFFAPVLLKARDPQTARHVHEHEVFGPVATVLTYSGDAAEAIELVRKGEGGLVTSVYSDDKAFTEQMVLGLAPFHGRVYLGSSKVRNHAMGSGLVLPQCVHGGPGRAGGGEELGGLRGVQHYMHRVAIQGSRPMVEKICDTKPES
ncbi:MAG: 3,4-dehydroadipyl-CoA semialdehyde dehydrogenase [Deltaproteobacteria bacterium]